VRPVAAKICGLVRPEDAAAAAASGARYVGTVLAGGPRRLDPAQARTVYDAAAGCTRVAVMGHEPVEDLVARAMAAGADIVQLHGDPSPRTVEAVREAWPGGVWAVLRVPADAFDADRAAALMELADGLVLDAFVPQALGGTGVALDWRALVAPLGAVRARAACTAELIVAGGLRPETVMTAIRLLEPDVVDVSSGVERAPGQKDHDRVRAFVAAARGDEEQLSLLGESA
jgi:phosphoribosylanthranilate isomerase